MWCSSRPSCSSHSVKASLLVLAASSGLGLMKTIGASGLPNPTWGRRRGCASRSHGLSAPRSDSAIAHPCSRLRASEPKNCRYCWPLLTLLETTPGDGRSLRPRRSGHGFATKIPSMTPVAAIDVKELRRRLEAEGPKPYLLDVREPWEYMAGHVPGAQLIPLGELEQRVGEVPREGEGLSICPSGQRHLAAAGYLPDPGHAAVRQSDTATP